MRESFKKIVAGTAAACAVALAACSPSVNTYENADAGAGATVIDDKRIITDWGTESFAYVSDIRTGTTPDGRLLRVQLEIVNATDDYARLVYTVEWFDAQGMKIAVPATWIPLSLLPAKHESLSFVAPNAAAKDFRVSLMRTE